MTKKEYYERLIKELKENRRSYQAMKDEYDKITKDRQSGIYAEEHIHKVIMPRQNELKRSMTTIQDKAYADVRKLTEEMGMYLRSLDALNPGDMTDDVKLFNSGVTLNKRDIQDIIDRNPNNRTMIQLALRYANEKGIEGLEHTGYISSESQLDTFKGIEYATKTVIKWFDKKDGYERMYSKLLGEGSDIETFCMND